jgi:hypothetical protein
MSHIFVNLYLVYPLPDHPSLSFLTGSMRQVERLTLAIAPQQLGRPVLWSGTDRLE